MVREMSERGTATVAEFYAAQAHAGRPVCSNFEPWEKDLEEGRAITEWSLCRYCFWSKNTHGMTDAAPECR